MPVAGIGVIKWFDRDNGRGVIAPKEMGVEGSYADDLFFQVGVDEAMQLKVGQLVQFVVEESEATGREAKHVTVLSQSA